MFPGKVLEYNVKRYLITFGCCIPAVTLGLKNYFQMLPNFTLKLYPLV